jgi:peptide/nickel transport system substrate-binding protein
MRGRWLRGLAAGAAIFAAAAGGAQAQTLTIGTKLNLTTLDPHFFAGFPTNNALSMIFNRLVEQDADQRLVPGLAESWRVVDDTTWEFRLRRGVTFHDGSPFDAADVLASFRRVPEVPNSPNAFTQHISMITETEVVDSHTLRFKTDAPTPLLPLELANVFIVSDAHEKASTDDFNSGAAAVGTGPYRLRSFANGDRLTVTRNPAYWGPAEPWETVVLRTVTSDPTRVAALLSGEVDVIDEVPIADRQSMKGDQRFNVVDGPASRVHYIAMDSDRDASPFVTAKDGSALARNPLKDPRVRKALSLAINREAIADRLMEGTVTPASQLLPSSIDGTSKTLRPDPFDPQRARALLAEAGYPDGFRLTLHSTNDRYPNDIQVAQAIGQMWTRIGLDVSIEGVPGAVFFGQASRQAYSMFIATYGTSHGIQPLRALIHTWDRDRGLGSANRVRFSDPEVDALIVAASTLMDEGALNAQLARAAELAMERQAVIPVYYPSFTLAARRGLAPTVRSDGRIYGMSVRPSS